MCAQANYTAIDCNYGTTSETGSSVPPFTKVHAKKKQGAEVVGECSTAEYDTMVYRKRENQKDGNGMVVPVMEPDGVDAL